MVLREQEGDVGLAQSARSALATSPVSFTPSASSTSAAPILNSSRGCRAWRPARRQPATTNATAVEMFSVCAPSPPVPQTSIAPSGARRGACVSALRVRRRRALRDRAIAAADARSKGRDLGLRRRAVEDAAKSASSAAHLRRPPPSRKLPMIAWPCSEAIDLRVELHAVDRAASCATCP